MYIGVSECVNVCMDNPDLDKTKKNEWMNEWTEMSLSYI